MTSDELAEFTIKLCEGLVLSWTPWRAEFIAEWARWEGTGAHYNPLATTMEGFQTNPANPHWNDIRLESGALIHVQNYATMVAGAAATARTLRLGYYKPVVSALEGQVIRQGDRPKLVQSIRIWGTTGFAQRIADGWTPAAAAPPEPAPPDEGWQDLEQRVSNVEAEIALQGREIGRIEEAHDSLNGAVLSRFGRLDELLDQLAAGADEVADPDEVPGAMSWESDARKRRSEREATS